MKLSKIIFILLLALSAVSMAGCDTTNPAVELTSITFVGAADRDVAYGESFNVLTDVTAVGNDGVDYTSQITIVSLATITSNLLDTNTTGTVLIRYTITVGTLTAFTNRFITVLDPERTGMVLNGDFSMGTTGWDTFSADGSTIALSVDNGALKVDVVAGSNPWTPRISQMGIPLVEDTVYEVSFRAKSSVEGKLVHLQVGEILSASPYFTNFKPEIQIEYVALTTEWATYSYKFTHVLDNQNGGLVFEFGNFMSQKLDATVWLDDIDVEESVLDPDTAAPVFTGVQAELTVLVDSIFDPLDGVTAVDIVDGDLTDAIDVTIYQLVGEVATLVTAVDTSVEGTYRIEYEVEDAAGNVAEIQTILTVAAMQFIETDIIENGDFATELTPWAIWSQHWGDVPTITSGVENGEFSLTTDKSGEASWAIQFNQSGLVLEQGVTYKLVFDAKTTVARDINVIFLIPDPVNDIYFKKDNLMLTTTMETYELLFTVTKATSNLIQLSFELGATANFAAGTTTFDNIELYEADVEEVLFNQDFSIDGWRTFVATWDGNAADIDYVDGQLVLNVTNIGDLSEGWKLQLIQDAFALGTGVDNQGSIKLDPATTYRVSFDAKASVAGNITLAIGVGLPGWYAYHVQPNIAITTTMDTYTVVFTTDAEGYVALAQLKFELAGLFHEQTGPQSLTLDNVKIEELVEAAYVDTNKIVNGTMDQVVNWSVFTGEGGAGTMTKVDGAAVIDVTNIGGDAWHVHLHNGEANTLTKGTYMFVIVAESSVARDIRANLTVPSQGFRSVLPDAKWDISLTTEAVMYTLTVNVTEDLFGIVKVEIDFGNLGGSLVSVPAEITVHSINIFKVYN